MLEIDPAKSKLIIEIEEDGGPVAARRQVFGASSGVMDGKPPKRRTVPRRKKPTITQFFDAGYMKNEDGEFATVGFSLAKDWVLEAFPYVEPITPEESAGRDELIFVENWQKRIKMITPELSRDFYSLALRFQTGEESSVVYLGDSESFTDKGFKFTEEQLDADSIVMEIDAREENENAQRANLAIQFFPLKGSTSIGSGYKVTATRSFDADRATYNFKDGDQFLMMPPIIQSTGRAADHTAPVESRYFFNDLFLLYPREMDLEPEYEYYKYPLSGDFDILDGEIIEEEWANFKLHRDWAIQIENARNMKTTTDVLGNTVTWTPGAASNFPGPFLPLYPDFPTEDHQIDTFIGIGPYSPVGELLVVIRRGAKLFYMWRDEV